MTTSTSTTDHGLPPGPLADTFDEATLRQLFPAAPAQLAVPRDVGSLFAVRMRSLGGARRGVLLAAWACWLLLGGVLALTAGALAGGLVAGAALLAAGGVAAWQHRSASDDFFERYAAGRGLHHAEDARVDARVPLFTRGDERCWPRVLSGTIAHGSAELAHYTYTDVSYDSDGNRSETDHDFTVLWFRLPAPVAARFAGISCGPRQVSFGALQDRLQDDRKVELESSEFHKRYSLRVADSQDDIALFELLSTSFVHRLATELHVYWEQRGEDLLVWKKGHETEGADLDRMCLEGWHVLHRYLEEHR